MNNWLMKKTFASVQLDDNGCYTVPTSWLKNDKMCFFPLLGNFDELKVLMKHVREPMDGWREMRIVKIRGISCK